MHSQSLKTTLVILAMVVSVAFAASVVDKSKNDDLNVLNYEKYIGENGRNDSGSVVTPVVNSDFGVTSIPTSTGNNESEKPGSTNETSLYQQEGSGDGVFDLIFAIPINILKSVNALLNQTMFYNVQQGSAGSETLMMFQKKLDAIFNIPITILSSVQNLLNWLINLG